MLKLAGPKDDSVVRDIIVRIKLQLSTSVCYSNLKGCTCIHAQRLQLILYAAIPFNIFLVSSFFLVHPIPSGQLSTGVVGQSVCIPDVQLLHTHADDYSYTFSYGYSSVQIAVQSNMFGWVVQSLMRRSVLHIHPWIDTLANILKLYDFVWYGEQTSPVAAQIKLTDLQKGLQGERTEGIFRHCWNYNYRILGVWDVLYGGRASFTHGVMDGEGKVSDDSARLSGPIVVWSDHARWMYGLWNVSTQCRQQQSGSRYPGSGRDYIFDDAHERQLETLAAVQ
jgi:hypothetical protein